MITLEAKPTTKTIANPLAQRQALPLDGKGRIQNGLGDGTGSKLGGSFFMDHLDASQQEHIGEIYLEGVEEGELYRFVDTTISTQDGPLDVSLLLYYHADTQQGWIFIEPRKTTYVKRELALATAA